MEEYFLQFDPVSLGLLGFCAVLLLVQLIVILIFHGRLAWYRGCANAADASRAATSPLPPLSVIISTRNQEHQLKSNLEAVLTQKYPVFEVVVVNDRSEDDTKWVLRDLELAHPHLKVVEIAEHVLSRQGKKFGVAMGIKAAQYDHVVLTDVDCTPASDQWLLHMGAAFAGSDSDGKTKKSASKTQIVIGYVPLQRRKGFLSTLIRFDHFYRSINYLAAALGRRAYMALGQNLAYEKELFFKGKGFASHIHVQAGYDDLFVNQHATRRNTRIVIHRDAHVWKPMPASSEAFFRERRLQREASRLYLGHHKFRLNMQCLMNVLFYLALLGTALWEPRLWPVLLGIYLLRLAFQFIIYMLIGRRLRVTRMFWFLPILDFIHTFHLGFRWYGRAKKSDGTLGSF